MYHIGQKFGERKVWQKFVKNQFDEIKFGENIKILITIAEL